MQRPKLLQSVSGDANTPLQFVGLLLVIGALILLLYATTTPGGSPTVAMLLLAVALAGALVGGTVGFLFGIPRFDYTDRRNGEEPKPGDRRPEAALLGTVAGASAQRLGRYRPSTNLEEIADWLSKIIVGLGLIQLTKVGPALQELAGAIASGCPGPCSSPAFVGAVVVYSVTSGLLFGYLWTRLHYSKMAAQSDVEVVRTLEELEAASVAEIGLGGPVRMEAEAAALERAGLPADVDPHKGKFGGLALANGRVLRAAIEPSEMKAGLYRITLAVSSVDPARPLRGPVTFYLHPTFRESVVTRDAVNGVASLTIIAYGAFTVGADADGGKTKLELDLSQHPEAPSEFRSR